MDVAQIVEIVKNSERVMAGGGRSKPALTGISAGGSTLTSRIDMTQHAGIIEYEPDEYTFTAKAGTSIKLLQQTVEAQGQYLPFDPLFVEDGATLGGTVAANTSGSGRFRYGGVRDFILGIRFVDGQGNLVRGGGKVVKNASGFDLPKFMVGSLGRYGILTEITMKVFPKPAEYRTLSLDFDSLGDALDCTFALANRPFEMDALDFSGTTMSIRLGGLPQSLPGRMSRLSDWLKQNTAAKTIVPLENDVAFWAGVNRAGWADGAKNLVKVPIAPKKVNAFDQLEAVAQAHYFSAGNVALITTDDLAGLDNALTKMGLNGLVLRGDYKRPILGNKSWLTLAKRVKTALDPLGKFLPA